MRRKIKTKTGISAIFLAVVVVLYMICSGGISEGAGVNRAGDIFENEEQYLQYITNNVHFDDINLKVITIRRGDNFWTLAKRHGINIDTLIGANPFWNNLLARVNQKIVVPSEKGVLHFVSDIDNIGNIARAYNVTESQVLVQDLPAFFRYYHRFLNEPRPIAVFIRDVKPRSCFMTSSLAGKYRIRELFRSPLGGRYSSFFGSRMHPIIHRRGFHNGVDIAAPYGTLVGAAREGRVVSTGWMGGYGKAVVIMHPGGYKTLYGHLSRILVRRGSTVRAGRIIGKVGSTGFSTGPHLHFTLWKNGRLLNPMDVLW